MKTVSFTEMKKGNKEDYLLLEKHEKKYIDGTADRLLKFMEGLNSTLEGYKIYFFHKIQLLEVLFNKDNCFILLLPCL